MGADFEYSLAPAPDLLDVAANFRGVTIRCPHVVALGGEWVLSGMFQLPQPALAAIDEQPHRALVLVAILGSSWYADSPLRQKIFFPDDLHAEGNLMRGYFAFDLFSLFQERIPGDYRLCVSLGEHLSESLLTEVR